MPSFESLPLWGNIAIFLVGAVFVWFAGVRIEAAVNTISRKTKIGTAFGGLVLLGIATSLPEFATTITGGLIGNPALVTNNLLGGVMMQTAILAVADCTLRRRALTSSAPQFSLLLGGVSLVMLLGLALAVMAVGDTISVANVGLGTAVIFAANVTLMYLQYRSGEHTGWKAISDEELGQASPPPTAEKEDDGKERSLRKAWFLFAGCSLLIFLAGWAVMSAAEALTKQTNIAASFVGAAFVAIATSLPELSTTIAAVRRGHNAMAISNIFGSNLWDVSLLFVGDIFFRSGVLLEVAPRQAIFTGSVGLVMTCVYLWGLLERRDRKIWRAGVDSILVLALYIIGLVALYTMG